MQNPVNSKGLIAYAKKEPVFEAALKLVTKLYQNKKRQFTGIQYVSHPMTVASVLLPLNLNVNVMAAAVLQETLSTKVLTADAMTAQFGEAVTAQVVALSSTGNLNEDGAQLLAAAPEVATIKLAAILDNVCAIPANKLRASLPMLRETEKLLPFLAHGDEALYSRVLMSLRRAIRH